MENLVPPISIARIIEGLSDDGYGADGGAGGAADFQGQRYEAKFVDPGRGQRLEIQALDDVNALSTSR